MLWYKVWAKVRASFAVLYVDMWTQSGCPKQTATSLGRALKLKLKVYKHGFVAFISYLHTASNSVVIKSQLHRSVL